MKNSASLRQQILQLVREYSRLTHARNRPAGDPLLPSWAVGDAVPYAGRVFDEDEVEAAVASTLDFWLTLGDQGNLFESEFSSFLGCRKTLLVNSGSSANLLAISAITSHKIASAKRLRPGDEVITVAAGFPTTVAPIVQVGAVPVFVDIDPLTGNINSEQLTRAYTHGKTKAVVLAHALGNPFDIYTVLKFCKDNELWLIEDNCDSLGSKYLMPVNLAQSLGVTSNSPGLDEGPDYIVRWTGTWGDLSTQSFYPPHHMTMGEGGAVNVNSNALLSKIVESYRDWGRDCWCPSGQDNSCLKRFSWKLGELPQGYDHKYIYSHMGYNLKPLDYQAAIGRCQLKKLPAFIEARKTNWLVLRTLLDDLSDHLDFTLPTHAKSWSQEGGFIWDDTGCKTDCSWFGFMVSLKGSDLCDRPNLARALDLSGVGNRMFFGGNLTKQPAFAALREDNPAAFRTVGVLAGSDAVMQNSLFVGVYPGMTREMLEYIALTIRKVIKK